MIKKWIRFACFCTLFLLLFMWGNHAYSIALSSWKDLPKIPRDSLDVIFIGNSHSMTGFQPRIVNDLLHINTYSFGSPGETVFISYYELREILKTQKPDLIVLESFTVNLTDLYIPPVIFHFTDSTFVNQNSLPILTRYLDLDNLYTAFPLMHQPIDWNHPEDFLDKFSDALPFTIEPIDPSLGFISTKSMLLKQELENARLEIEADSKMPLDENLAYLEKFIQLSGQKGIPVLFTTIPPVKIFGERFNYYVPFDAQTYAAEHQLDYFEVDTTQMTELHRFDPGHLNDFGSIDASIQIAQQIGQLLGKPVDQEQLNFYRSYLFDNYELKNSGDHFTFTLFPLDRSAPLEYCYTIKDYPSRQVISTTGWQTDPVFPFDLAKGQDLFLDVEVRVQGSDFTLAGELVVIN